MVRILILVIFAAIAFALAYTFFKTIPMKKKMTIIAGAVAAAAVGVLLQSSLPLYTAMLAILAISLIGALVYTKLVEKDQQERKRQSEERRAARQRFASGSRKSSLDKTQSNELSKTAGMNTDNRKRKGS